MWGGTGKDLESDYLQISGKGTILMEFCYTYVPPTSAKNMNNGDMIVV